MFIQTEWTLYHRNCQSGHAAFSALVGPIAIPCKLIDDPCPSVQECLGGTVFGLLQLMGQWQSEVASDWEGKRPLPSHFHVERCLLEIRLRYHICSLASLKPPYLDALMCSNNCAL